MGVGAGAIDRDAETPRRLGIGLNSEQEQEQFELTWVGSALIMIIPLRRGASRRVKPSQVACLLACD